MYSRFSNSPPRNVQIPEHYSGCAFSAGAPSDLPSHALGVARPTPPPTDTEPPSPPVYSDALHVKEDVPPPPPPTASPSEHTTPSALPLFANGLDFDQLLILGLILLLSHSGKDSDIVLWLGLLLFCG